MPQKLIRKVDLSVNNLITNTVGNSGELLQDAGPSSLNHNLANHIVENNLNGNAGSPFPNKIESLFDNVNNTQVRIVGHPDDGGVTLTATAGSPADNSVTATNRRGFFIFDLGRKINPRKFQLILDGSTRFILDSECLDPNNPPDKGVRLKFTNDLTNLAGGVQTAYKDNGNTATVDDFTDVTVAAGVAPHTEINTSGVTSIKGDTSSFDQRVLTLDENFFGTDYDGYRFFIVEFRGSRYSYTFEVFDISLFEEVDPRIYNVEFDDSVLDLSGWKNPRYAGSKLTGQKINEFNRGDISYGKNPVIERKTTAIYIADSCIGAEDEDKQFTFIENHSYIGIKQILVINQDDNSVQIIDRSSETEDVFQKFITTDFPEGSSLNVKIIDDAIQHNLKGKHTVKFNRGFLLKSFSYDGDAAPLPYRDLDGVFATNENNSRQLSEIDPSSTFNPNVPSRGIVEANPFKLVDFIESRVVAEFATLPDVPSDEMQSIFNVPPRYRGFRFVDQDFGSVYAYDYFSNPLEITLDDNYLKNGPEPGDISVIGQGSFRFYLGRIGDQPLMVDENTKLLRNKFTIPFLDGNDPKLTTNILPTFAEYLTHAGDTNVSNPNLPNNGVGSLQTIIVSMGNTYASSKSIKGLSKPNESASLFISECLDFLKDNSTETELYLTLHKGRKSFVNIDQTQGPLSIGTFEVDPNIPSRITSASGVDSFTALTPRENFLSLKNNPSNKPKKNFLIDLDEGSAGSNTTLIFEPMGAFSTDDFPYVINGVEETVFGLNRSAILSRVKTFEGGPGYVGKFGSEPNSVSGEGDSYFTDTVDDINTTFNTTVAGFDVTTGLIDNRKQTQNPVVAGEPSSSVLNYPRQGFFPPAINMALRNSENYPGSINGTYSFQLSFLDKGPTLITNLSKESELFDGIGEKGLVLVPEFIEGDIRKNIDFYLRKAGIIEKKTIKAPPRPERGR